MLSFSGTARHVARKPYRCNTCEMLIDAGDTYERSVSIVFGQILTYREHPECRGIGERSAEYADPDYPDTYDADSTRAYLSDLGEDAALREARTDEERDRIRKIFAGFNLSEKCHV